MIMEQNNIQYVQLTKDRLREAVDVARKSFFVDEIVCKALDLKNNLAAMDELEELFVKAAKDGVSVIAIEKDTATVVGVSFNKLQIKSAPDADYYQNYSDRCKEPASKGFLSFMKDADIVVNMFEHCQADCYMEIMFLGVLSGYRGKSIAYNLCKTSETVARTLFAGKNIKQNITETPLALEPLPKFLGAIFTSAVSQKIGLKMDMKLAESAKLDRWVYQGQTFAERLGNDVVPIQYRYKFF